MEQQQTKLGLTGLTPIIIGRTIGEGIFNISKVLTEPCQTEYNFDIHLLLFSSGVYLIGIFFYWPSQHKIITPQDRLFTTADHNLISLLVIALVFSPLLNKHL